MGFYQVFIFFLLTFDVSNKLHFQVILSACSSYFENLFMTFDEKNQIVILKDASFIDVYALIEFIYKGEVNIGQVSNQLKCIKYIWSIYGYIVISPFSKVLIFNSSLLINYRIDCHLYCKQLKVWGLKVFQNHQLKITLLLRITKITGTKTVHPTEMWNFVVVISRK